MLIGQAPGPTEAVVKRPFNAGSGKRLFKWLAEAGWDEADFRAHVYMTAVTKCYPGRSDNGKGDRVATPFEQALCRPWLEQEFRLIDPRLLILVGGLAIRLAYPAAARLDQIIGTAAWFPPGATAGGLSFELARAEVVTTDDDRPPTAAEGDAAAQTVEGFLTVPESDSGSGQRSAGGGLPIGGRPPGGRWLVPLPHPSGASLWPNRPENRALISRAMALLREIRAAEQL